MQERKKLCLLLLLSSNGLDVEDELQQADKNQQTHSAGLVVLSQVTFGPQPTGVPPSRCLPGPHLPAATATGRQPAPAAPPSHLCHLHSDGSLPSVHFEASLPVRQ